MNAAEPQEDRIQKVLLMGRMAAGKTSMRSIIFANYLQETLTASLSQ